MYCGMISLSLFPEALNMAVSKDDKTHKAKLVKGNFIFVQVARRLQVFSLKPMTKKKEEKKKEALRRY